MTMVPELFGSMVFNDKVMQERLPKSTYKALRKTMENGEPGVKLVLKKQTEILNAREYIELLFGKEFWSYYLFFFR